MKYDMHGTTIISVRKNDQVAIGGDGQVTLGNCVMKGSAKKVRNSTKVKSLLALPEVPPMHLLYLSASKLNSKNTKDSCLDRQLS